MDNKIIALVAVILVAGAGALLFDDVKRSFFEPTPTNLDNGASSENSSVQVVAEDLEVPWDIEFLPNGDMLVTERPGNLIRIGGSNDTYEVPGVEHTGEGGLLGVTLHPDFEQNRYIYLYHTTETEDGLTNRVIRYTYQDNELTDPETIIEDLPGAVYHDGGRIDFGPDGYLYITVGDATERQMAQDTSAMHGKILRLNPDGSVPESNPFDNEVYSYGHRNPQGITWENGNMWSTEHGSTATDEINLIEMGENYGWPQIRGDQEQEGMQQPVRHSGQDETWAPAGMTHLDNTLYFTGLRGQSLYSAELDGQEIVSLETHFRNDFGRLRDVTVGPDGDLYIATSNRDGRGSPQENDDRIIRIEPSELE